MAKQGLRNPLHQAADDIQSQTYQLPQFERPEVGGLGGRSPGSRSSSDSTESYDFGSSDGLLPPPDMEPLFMSTAERHGVPVNVLMALAQQESNYRPDAIGVPTQWGRAKGMMQYIDPTAEGMGINPLDPEQSLDAAAKQLKDRLAQGYSMEEAVMAHHGGDDRAQWGPKTQRYGRMVLGKAGAIYEQAAPREPAQPENPRAFGESGVPLKPKSQTPIQNGQPDAFSGAARPNEQAQQAGSEREQPMGAGQRLRQGMQDNQPEQPAEQPQVDGFSGAAVQVDPAEVTARKEATQRGKATVLTDFGNLLQIGADRGVLSFREGVRQVLGDKVVDSIDRVDEWMNGESSEDMFERQIDVNEGQLSQEMFDARRKDWVSEDDDGYSFGPAWGDWRSYAAGMVESLPETAVTMVPGAVLAKGVYANGIARGLSTAQAGRAAATTATVAGGLTEGFLGGGASAREVKNTIEGMSEEQLKDSEALQAMQDSGMSFEEARAQLADDSSTKAFVLAGTLTGAFGGMGDRALAKMLTEGSSNRFTAGVRGAVSEGLLEELPQEAAQQASENYVMQDADPSIQIRDNVPNAAVGGMIAGAGMGAGMGAAFGGKRNTPADIMARELNRSIDAASAQGTEGEALRSMEPAPLEPQASEAGESISYPREQWEADWSNFDMENPGATLNGAVGDIGMPAPGGAVESAIQESEQAERVAATQGERVVVRTRTGEISGTVQSYQEDGSGAFKARVLGDDGSPYIFNEGDDVKIVREDAAEAAPRPPVAEEAERAQAAPGPASDAGNTDTTGMADTPTEPMVQEIAPPSSTSIQDLSDEELQAQRQYVATQARQSGWSTPLNKRRKEIKAELERREAAAAGAPEPAAETAPPSDLAALPYGGKQWNQETGKAEEMSGQAEVVDYSGRRVVMKNINGVMVPFYQSTGAGGKTETSAGKWYPFMGIGKDGWLNKLSGKDLADYYGSPALRRAAEELDASLGDLRDRTDIPKTGMTGAGAAFIDAVNGAFPGQQATENNQAESLTRVEASIAALKQAIDGDTGSQAAEPTAAPTQNAGTPTNEPIVEHVTGRGKTLRGVVRQVTQDEAKAIDPYTFKKDGGWFIREKRLAEAGETASVQADVPRESLMFTNAGKPFKSYEQAQRKINNRGLSGKPVQTEGGWGIQLDATVDIERARQDTNTEPSEAQAEAGNYKKGRVSFNGFDIAIENPRGSTRRGTDPEGNAWESTMAHDYGDIKGTKAADGDNLDVFLGDELAEDAPVYVVDQINDDGSFDEHKVMIGFPSQEAARKGYLDNYDDGWQGLGDITELGADSFRAWAQAGDLSQPVSSNAVRQAEQPAQDSGSAADKYAERMRTAASRIKGTYEGRPMTALAGDIADHAIENGRRLTDAEVTALAEKHQVEPRVVGQMAGGPFSYEGLLEGRNRGHAGAAELLERARGNAERAKSETSSRRASTANTKPRKKGELTARQRRASEAFGGAVPGDTVTLSQDAGYARSGTQYKVNSIGKDGSLDVTNVERGSSTVISRAEWQAATNANGAAIAEVVVPQAGDLSKPVSSNAVRQAEKAPAATAEQDGIAERWRRANEEDHAEVMRLSRTSQRYANSDYTAMPEGVQRRIRSAFERMDAARGTTPAEAESAAPPITDASRENRKRDTFKEGRMSALEGEAREVPEWYKGDEQLENQWLAGYGEGIALRPPSDTDTTESNSMPSDQGPHYAAGWQARMDGQARELPSYFTSSRNKNAKDWMRGWDAAAQEAPTTPEPEAKASTNTIFTEDAAEKARAILKAKLGQLNTGIDPEIMQAGITLAGYHIEKGARSFAAYASAMTGDLGDVVKPYLKSWYAGVYFDPRAEGFIGMSDPGEIAGMDIDAILAETSSNDTTVSEEPSSERQTYAPRSGEDQSRSSSAVSEREPGRDTQQSAAPTDSGSVEDAPQSDVAEPTTAGDRPRVRRGAAAADVGGAGASNRQRDAGDRSDADSGAGASNAGTRGERTRGEPAGGERARVTPPRAPESVSPANPGPGNFYYDNPLDVVGGGQVARFNKNQAAIDTYLTLRDEDREATREEQETLAGYTGWGSFGQELFQGSWERPQPKAGWEARDRWLRDHLGESEWKGMQRSIINAHYTDPPTTMAMWSMMERMGFKGGRVLEPSMGIGNFFGMMPRHLASRSQLTGIELDPITGGMAQKLYPDAGIRVMGYQDSKTPDDYYDVVIGNWPFENSPLADRRYNKFNPMVHDYFFLKALDQVRPGGIVMAITSAGSMDKKDARIRRELAKKGELIAAYRLPSGAFKEYAGTSVVTDILVLRKRAARLENVSEEGWIQSEPMKTKAGTDVSVNEYFHQHPENVIGEIDFGTGSTYGRPSMIVHRPSDMQAQIDRIVTDVPEGTYRETTRADNINYITNHTDDREGSLTRTKDGLHVVRGEQLAPAEEVAKYRVKDAKATADREAQLDALIGMRKQYAELIEAERSVDGNPDPVRKKLKKAYDAYVKTNGPLNGSFGIKYLDKIKDPFAPSLRALERKEGKAWKPATILERSTIRTPKRIDNPSIEEAYVLARNGAVNPSLSEIAERSNSSEEAVRKTLIDSGAIFSTPGGDIVPSDVYLSGNVRQKLRDAEGALAEGVPDMQRNVDALKEALPADIPYFNIEVQMGASWVPTGVYEDFVAHMLDLSSTNGISVRYDVGRWKVRLSSALVNREEARTGYGTKAYNFTKLVNAAISNQTVTIKKTIDMDGSKTEVLDREATDETNNKISEMREKFGEWLWSDADRRDAMETEYNEVRNSYASPRYDGSFLRFEGMALEIGTSPFNLRQHQADAVWRALVTRKSLNAHEVGTGKSFTLAGIAVESRRYGIAKKPLVFAHNANSASVAGDINVMYPAAKVLYLDNLTPKEIDTRLRQIANDDWDAIVVPHSLIDRFSFKEDTLMAMAQEDIEALEREAYEAAQEEGGDLKPEMFDDEAALKKLRSPTAKNLVKQRNRIIESIKKQAQRASRENAVTFEDLGVDMVLVDEVHEFKKPPITTKMRVKGLQTDTSQRSLQLRFITDYIRANNNGANVHTFTGTPITNTLTEIFHQMRYIMKEDMAATGVDQWDGWFGSFAKEVQDVELNGAGDWETVNRLRGFINVPELRKLVGMYMDVVFSDDMPEMQPRQTSSGKTLDDPSLTERERAELLNGRTEGATDRPYKQVITDTADLTDDQKAIFRLAQERSQAWKNMGGKERKEAMANGSPEVPIQVEALVAKASFDARLARDTELAGMEGQVPDEPDSKLSRAIAKVVDIYNSDPNANQVVFSNSGLGTSATRSVRNAGGDVERDNDGNIKKKTVKVFSSMRDMIERLVQNGIPREQIALVDGSTNKAKRKEIAEAMNRSEIRVVIGSTQSLGVGVNMQRNLRAMHHLDAPYMPGDLEQRNGRGKRQANQWNTVQEHRYITDRLDGRRWQILSIKQQFIEDFLKADGSQRVIEGDAAEEEQSDILETFAEAAGDPRILIRTKLESQRDQLRKRQRLHEQGIKDAKRSQQAAKEQRSRQQGTLDRWEKDGVVEAAREAVKSNAGKAFSMEVDGTTYTDRKEADEALKKFTSQELVTGSDPVALGEYGGMTVMGAWGRFSSQPNLVMDVNGETVETGVDSIASLESTLRNFPDRKTALEERVAELDRSIERLGEVQQQPFARAEKLKSTERQLDALEADLADNPVPPPAWLRQGAPIDTDVKWRGNDYTVTGHRWNEAGWFVLSEGAKGQEVQLPYAEVVDSQGMPLYEAREFEAPALASDIPMDILRSHKPGMRMVTTDPTTNEEVAVEITRAPFREGGKDSPVQVMARFPNGETRQIPVSSGEEVSKTLAAESGAQTTSALTEGLRSNRLAGRMLDQGRIQLHANVAATGRQLPGATAGFVDRNGKVHLIAGNIAPGNEIPALMHEVFHNAVQPLAGSAEWSRLENDLRALRSRARRARGKFRDIYREAQARVEAAKAAGDTMTPQREVEEFGAYAIEQYERMPKTLRTWVDNAIGAMKAWMRDKLGVQLGQVTPPQLRAIAVAGMRSRRLAPGVNASPASEPLSVADDSTPAQRKAALDDAIDAMDGKTNTPPSVGRVIGDMSRIAKFFAHPRTIASLHKSFQPVYQTGINQFEMRDAIIDDLYQNYRTYSRLNQAKKAKVNKVLELGRLLGTTWEGMELEQGVIKPATHPVAKFTPEGKPYIEHEPLHAELTKDNEKVVLTEEEIDAYQALRQMFDGALDMFRDQTLDDYKLSEFKGMKNSAGAILDTINDEMNTAEAERRKNVARFIAEIEQAKRTGYVPFTRYGDYVVTVKEKLAKLDIIKASDPQGGWIVRNVPEKLEKFLAEVGAPYDNLEGAWRLDRPTKQALEKENERTVYSTKVETGLRDMWKQHKAMKAEQREDGKGARLDNIPAVKDAIEKLQNEWVKDNPLRQVRAFPTAKISGGNPVSLTDLDALAEISSIDNETWDAVRDQLADTIKGLSFRKHFFQAQNVPGYSADFERSITDYMGGMGGYLSRRHHQQQWDDSVEKIKGERLREYAEKYRAYANSPQEEYAMLRQVGFLSYIAGNLATAFVNTTQVPVMTMPALSMVAGSARAAKEVTVAYKDAIKMYGRPRKVGLQMFDPEKAPADVRAAITEAWGKGAFVPLETFEVMAASRIRHAGQRRARRGFESLVQGTAYAFTAAERLNRLVTFIASARLARNPKVEAKARRVLAGNYHARQTVLNNWTPESFAEYIIDETQYRMGKANRPTIMRNVGAPIMQFKSFMFQTLETWYRWSTMQGKEGKMSAAASIAMMVGLGGLWGFPGGEDARDLAELLWRKLTKEDIDLESELRVWIYDKTGSRALSEGVTKGLSYPAGLDLSRVGMGQIMPQGVDGVFGIPFDMFVGRPSRAMTDITNENYPAAAAEFVPNAIRNVIQAAQWSLDGAYDSKGRKLLDKEDISTTAKLQRAVGFQPAVVSQVRDYEWAQYRDQTRIYQLKRLYTDRLGRRIADMVRAEEKGDAELAQELEQDIVGIYEEIEQHNMSAAPEDIIEVGQQAINNRVAREFGGVATTWGKEGRRAARGSAARLREVYGLDEILNED